MRWMPLAWNLAWVLSMAVVTVAMSCYRDGGYLREAISSVLSQTSPEWRMSLVLDGGADEETRGVFDGVSDSRVRKFAFAENMGPYVALNKAVEMSESTYVLPMGADDLLPSDCIERILGRFEEAPDLDFTYGDIRYFGEFEKVDRFSERITVDNVIPKNAMPGVIAYRKGAWEELGGYAVELRDGMADYDFNIGLVEAGFEGGHIGGRYIYYHYRQKPSGHVSGSYFTRIYEKRRIVVERHPKLFSDDRLRCLFLGFGALTTADHLGQAGEYAGCRRMAWEAFKYRYIRLGTIFMLIFSFPFSKIRRFFGMRRY